MTHLLASLLILAAQVSGLIHTADNLDIPYEHHAINLQHIDPSTGADLLRATHPHSRPQVQANGLTFRCSPRQFPDITQLFKTADVPIGQVATKFISLNNLEAKATAEELNLIFQQGRPQPAVNILPDTRTHRIFFMGHPALLLRAEALLEAFDQPDPEG